MEITKDIKDNIAEMISDLPGCDTTSKIIAIVYHNGVKHEVHILVTNNPNEFIDYEDVQKFDYPELIS